MYVNIESFDTACYSTLKLTAGDLCISRHAKRYCCINIANIFSFCDLVNVLMTFILTKVVLLQKVLR